VGRTLEVGRRIELVSMDRHFHDITIGLYEQPGPEGSAFRLHTYSRREGAPERIAFLNRAMEILGGLSSSADGALRFPCGERHVLAVKRVFLDAWKLPTSPVLSRHPLSVFDKKCNCTLTARYTEPGRYDVVGEHTDEEILRRCTVYARGLIKLAGLGEVSGSTTSVEFSCHQPHDALVGLLMLRAGDVRTAMREAAMMAARGVLSAPSNQPVPE